MLARLWRRLRMEASATPVLVLELRRELVEETAEEPCLP